MNITHLNDTFPGVLIDNFYSDEELKLLWREIDFLSSEKKMDYVGKDSSLHSRRKDVSSAADDQGNFLRTSYYIWMDEVYLKREYSDILTVNRKLFYNFKSIFLDHPNWIFNTATCTEDRTLLSYYSNNDQYKKHQDTCYITVLTWFYKEPKQFDGGDLIIYNNGGQTKIDLKNNRVVAFPGRLFHEVTPVISEQPIQPWHGRYCMSQFLIIK